MPGPLERASPIRFRAFGAVQLDRPGSGELRALLVQPKRLALFAYLVLSRPSRLHRRDSLLALFWPESSDEHARQALRQALHFLRRTLGHGALESRGDDEIGIDFGSVWCDVLEFDRAVDESRLEGAVDLYRGHLLEGFHVSDVAPELDQWIELERSRLRTRAVEALSLLADGAERAGNLSLARHRLREMFRLDSGNETALRRLMILLERTGDRAGALRAYEEFARHVAAELDAEPSPESVDLAERMRGFGDAARGVSRARAAPVPAVESGFGGDSPEKSGGEVAGPPAEVVTANRWSRSRTRRVLPVVALALAIGLALGARWLFDSSGERAVRPPSLAVRAVDDRTGADSRELGQPAPSPSLASLTTTSIVARRFYDEGVRLHYQFGAPGALRLFRAALAEDSTFAMAAYLASQAALREDPAGVLPYAAHAVRISGRTTERERLLIALHWAELTNSVALVPLADSLRRGFPLEPEADFALGRALVWSGDHLGAIPHLRRAVQRDSARLFDSLNAGGSDPGSCTACAALNHLVGAFHAVDSLEAATRVAREWIAHQPRSPLAWMNLAVSLSGQGRTREALEALRTRQALYTGEPPDDAFHRVQVLLHAGEFEEADALLAERHRTGAADMRRLSLWWQVISLRNQGRFEEALRTARQYQLAAGDAGPVALLPKAQVLLEMGRAREAVAQFQAALERWEWRLPPGAPDAAIGVAARHFAWNLTHVSTACAAAGDTARLALLADSVEMHGALGAYGRDRRLHHHVRGLLWIARGRPEDAVSSLRSAISSPTLGYTRTNLELGSVLLASGRPREAVAVLRPALRGDLQASNYYVTHSELHEMLAAAFEADGQRDSARVHYAWVASAWRGADPPLRSRAATASAKSR